MTKYGVKSFVVFMLLAFSSAAQPTAGYAVLGDTNLNPIPVCRNYSIDFLNISTGGFSSVSWVFSGGNPATAATNSVNVTWVTNGTKACSITVTDTNGVSSTLNFNVVVSSTAPSVSFGNIPDLCSSDPSVPLTQGVPFGGYYFGLGVVNDRFDPGIADTGYHTLGYVYTGTNGCRDTAYSTVYVRPGPTAGLLELNNFSNCNGFSASSPNFLIELYDQSLINPPDSIVFYKIVWGDGSPDWDSSGFRPGITHTYFGQGIFPLQFIVTSSNGCTDTANYLVVNTTNPASLNLTNPGGTNGCAPVTVTFPVSTSNTDPNIVYMIEWGDGKDTTFGHPPPAFVTHTYDTTSCIRPGGFFNIRATASNPCVSTQSTIQGPFVTQRAVAEFVPASGCVGVLHALNNMSIPGYTNACSRLTTYIWDFGDGSPPVTQLVNTPLPPPGTHIWTSPGIYNVTLISVALGGNCPGDTVTYPVCIEGPIVPAVSFIDTAACLPLSPIISNNSDTSSLCEAIQFGWFMDTAVGYVFNSGSSFNEWEPDITFTQAGTYELSFYINSVCGGDTITQKIYVWDRPSISLPQNLQPYCDTVQINTGTNPKHIPTILSNGQPITSYLWRISPQVSYINGTDSTSQFPEFILPPGPYSIQLIVSNSCGSDTAVQSVVVNPLTNGGFITSTNAGCGPLSVNVQSTSTPNVQHTWFIDGMQYSTAMDTSFVLTNTGITDSIYQIMLVVYSGIGCQDTLYDYVTVYPNPSPFFVVGNVCVGNTTSFIDSSTNAIAPIASWSWSFGDGQTASVQNPQHNYALPGKYQAALTVTDTNGCSEIYTDSVQVYSIPTAAFAINYASQPDSACVADSIFFVDASTIDSNGTSINSWQWDVFDDGTIDFTTQNCSYVFSVAGSFPVRLTVTSASGCTSSVVDTIHISKPSLPAFVLSTYGGCTPLSVAATNQSSGYITNYNWSFYTLDSNGNQIIEYSSTSSDPNPIPPFQANVLSNKTVFAQLTASNSCYSATFTDTINIKPIPIPFFAFSSDTGCSPLSVNIQVDGLATGNPDSIVFDFGDGSNSLVLYPNINILPNGDTLYTWNQQQHTFTYLGNKLDTTYYVTLYARNECGDSSFSQPIVVRNRSVQSFFTANKNSGCTPLTVSFTDYSFAALSTIYCFDFDTITKTCSGATFSGRNATHVFSQPGTYVVAQFGFNTCGSDTSYQVITVFPGPNIQFAFQSPSCQADTVVFANSTTLANGSITGYKWFFGDGDSSTLSSPAHYYQAAGTYNVCLQVTSTTGCDSTYCQQIVIHPNPTAAFGYPAAVCFNEQPVPFTNLSTNPSGNIASYEWFFGDGGTATQPNPAYSYTTLGTYDVKLRVTNTQGCQDSIIQAIVIHPSPTADFTWVYTNGDSCGVPNTIQFTNNSNGAGGYFWDFNHNGNPNQDTSIQMHPQFTYQQPGYFDVMLISKNGLGCQDTVVKTINIHPVPQADFLVNTTAGCAPLDVLFNNTTTLTPGFTDSITYTWYFGDGTTSNQKNPLHVYQNPGTYTAKLVAQTEYACADSIVYSNLITVFPVPVPNFDYQLIEFGVYEYRNLTTGGTPPYTSYSWDFDDGTTSSDANPTHEFIITRMGWDQGFLVCLTVTDQNDCDSTFCDTIKIGTFTLYVPNAMAPDAEGEAKVFLPKGMGLQSYSCKIFDRWGNVLWESTALDPITANPIEAWDGTYLGEPVPAGVYFWRIDATFANGVIWRGNGTDAQSSSNSGTITIIR